MPCWASNCQLTLQFGKCHCSLGSWMPGCRWSIGLSLKWLKKEKSDSSWSIFLKTLTKWKILHQSIYRINFPVLNFDILDQLRENFTFIFTLGKHHSKTLSSFFTTLLGMYSGTWVKWLFHPSLHICCSCLNLSLLNDFSIYETKLTQQCLTQKMHSLSIRYFWWEAELLFY